MKQITDLTHLSNIDPVDTTGALPMEGTVQDLIDAEVSTYEGQPGNGAFTALESLGLARSMFRGYLTRHRGRAEAVGMFHIQCTEEDAAHIERAMESCDGGIVANGPSAFGTDQDEWWEFEIC